MVKVNLSTKLPVSTKQVWDLIGNFNALPDWHPAVERSEIEEEEGGRGVIRRLHLLGGGTLVERLEKLDDSEHLYSYEILESPLPVADYHATLRVREEEGGCTVVVERVRAEGRAGAGRRGGDPGHLRRRAREPEEDVRRLTATRPRGALALCARRDARPCLRGGRARTRSHRRSHLVDATDRIRLWMV